MRSSRLKRLRGATHISSSTESRKTRRSSCERFHERGSPKADLFHQTHKVVEQSFLHDLAILPGSHGAEFDLELLARGRDLLAVRAFHRSLEGPRELCDGAGVVPFSNQYLVRPVHDVVVGERLEELHRLGLVILLSTGRFCSTRPMNC